MRCINKKILLAAVAILLLNIIILISIPSLAAIVADRIARPVLGNKATIALESVYFSVQEQFKKYFTHSLSNSYYRTSQKQPLLTSPSTPPPNLIPAPIFIDAVAQEGQWQPISGTPLYSTFIRTDSTRSYAVVNLVYIPLKNIGIGSVAGTIHPGGENKQSGPGKIPQNIQDSGRLLVAFNGGFAEQEGHYGMYANNTYYVPLKNDLATLFIYSDGHTELKKYDGTPLSSSVLSARQNGALLVENSNVTLDALSNNGNWSGSTNTFISWRSGIGILPNGALVYAVGPSLSPESLAKGLQQAGCVYAMQLDINDHWVRFEIYQWDSNHFYSWKPLIGALFDGGAPYLSHYEKDFFYLYKK